MTGVGVTICVLSCLGCGLKPKPDNSKIYNDRGMAKANSEQYENAIADFDTAIRLNPEYSDAYYNRGSAKAKLADSADSIGVIVPDLASTKFETVYEQYKNAIADFDSAIRLKRDYPYAYCNRGNTKVKLADYILANGPLFKFETTSEPLTLLYAAIKDYRVALELAEQAGDAELKTTVEAKLQQVLNRK